MDGCLRLFEQMFFSFKGCFSVIKKAMMKERNLLNRTISGLLTEALTVVFVMVRISAHVFDVYSYSLFIKQNLHCKSIYHSSNSESFQNILSCFRDDVRSSVLVEFLFLLYLFVERNKKKQKNLIIQITVCLKTSEIQNKIIDGKK